MGQDGINDPFKRKHTHENVKPLRLSKLFIAKAKRLYHKDASTFTVLLLYFLNKKFSPHYCCIQNNSLYIFTERCRRVSREDTSGTSQDGHVSMATVIRPSSSLMDIITPASPSIQLFFVSIHSFDLVLAVNRIALVCELFVHDNFTRQIVRYTMNTNYGWSERFDTAHNRLRSHEVMQSVRPSTCDT